MKTLMIALTATLAAASVLADAAPKAAKVRKEKRPDDILNIAGDKMTRAEFQNMLKETSLSLNGGIIREANSAKGWFVVVDAQKAIAPSNLVMVARELDKAMRIQVKTVVTNGVTLANVGDVIRAAGAAAGVAVIEDPSLPAFLTAPECGWTLVNVTALAADKPDAATLASRVRKEALRGYAFVTGAPYMSRGDFLMRDVRNLADIDRIPKETFGLEVMGHSLKVSERYGITPWRQASYKKACKEGWAPAPTNDYQKAIWNEIHALPSNPIKIKYDPKRDK